uniref:separase n=1 Tax=Dracunculus medinensis TaxID=318479 RepID=A0A0N4U4M9_DRAME
LALFPFEMMPVFEHFFHISRIPSIYFTKELLNKSKSNKIPLHVDGKNTYYLVDPGGDLHDTRTLFSKLLKKYDCWKGCVGEAPQSKDLLQYMGHGSGIRYFGTDDLRKCCCRAVSVLMGCSRILHEGRGFDGRGHVYDYHIAKCPCLIGCLWTVSDGEIDRFISCFLEYSFFSSNYRFLLDGIGIARYACKLRYLTGASVVSYGLPITVDITGIRASNGEVEQ